MGAVGWGIIQLVLIYFLIYPLSSFLSSILILIRRVNPYSSVVGRGIWIRAQVGAKGMGGRLYLLYILSYLLFHPSYPLSLLIYRVNPYS